ncbi:MAG: methyl-accepting chemotaxis protein, partial [Cyanobacteria bacterium J06600_6]
LISKDKDIAYASVTKLDLTLIWGVGVIGILVAIFGTVIANQATLPILNLVEAVKKIGMGDLEIELSEQRQDEYGELNVNVNQMTKQIKQSLEEQRFIAQMQKDAKQKLEQDIFALLEEVADATEGDLTVRANSNSMELGTVADLFNAIIDNLHDIAIEAKKSSGEVGKSLKHNENEIRLLSEQAIVEANETRETLFSVEKMSSSIQEVAANASQAEQITDDAYNTIVDSTNNMDLTADSIIQLRATVGETAKKMKRLGESSQKISQVVSFIEEIALKTNVLAINASVEAGRAGEYGQGFTIVAEQVGSLAEQSAAATKEIASIVSKIQSETQEVNHAMETGTTQVVETTRLVESTKESLSLVLGKSQEINQLMESISQTTESQAHTSQNVTSLMQKIADLSEKASQSSAKVAQSIEETAKVAAQLENTVDQFKVAK